MAASPLRKRTTMPEIGPYSRPKTLWKLDGRRKEAAPMRRVRSELTAHCGGNPSAVQRALIERVVILSLRVEQLDAKIVAGEALTVHDSNYALAWNNALRRTLAALGVEPAAAGRAALDEPRRVEYIVVDPERREADKKPTAPSAVEYEVVDGRG